MMYLTYHQHHQGFVWMFLGTPIQLDHQPLAYTTRHAAKLARQTWERQQCPNA